MPARCAVLMCVVSVVPVRIGSSAPAGSHVLFDFEQGGEGWHVNVYGKGKITFTATPDAKVGAGTMAVAFDALAGGNLISPAISFGQPWRQRRYDRIRFWAKPEAPMTKAQLVFVTDEAEHNTYALHFVMDAGGWQRHEYPATRGWNRGKKRLDPSRVTRMYVSGSGTARFALDHVELLEAAREVHLRPDRHVVVRRTSTPPTIDAKLDDAAWKQAAHLTGFVRYGAGKPAVDRTEAWVTYDASALYVAARLYTGVPGKLKATETARDAAVYGDDCLEVFVDPGHTHREWYQFVANSIGSQFDGLMPGGTTGRGVEWNGSWTVKAAVGADAWTVEMRLPLADFGVTPKPGAAWGFNVCREAPSTGELSMWTDTGGKFTRVRGLADLVFAEGTAGGASVTNVRLEEQEPGRYVLRADTRASRATKVAYRLWSQSPDDVTTPQEGRTTVAAGESDLALPVTFKAEEEGEAKLWFSLQDADTGALAAYGAYNFQVRFPSQADLAKLVLVPTPKELKLAGGAFAVTSETLIAVGGGEREPFVGEVIQRELQEYYGVSCPVRVRPSDVKRVIHVGRPDTSPSVREALGRHGLLERIELLKPEGYVLVVEPDSVLIAGKDDRGTYYGARTFLQLVAHATPEGQPPAAPCATVVDWPDFPFRSHMIYLGGWPQDPQDPELVKEFIYKQVAGYKFNTLVWNINNGYRYARWPRLRTRCAWPRETVQAVARFARNHFVECIPNVNLHGHTNWIVLPYKHVQEEATQNLICTRRPDTYRLLFDVIEELLDVFDRPKRFHCGLDEVRWKTFNLPEEKRCPRCRGAPKWRIFADHVNKLHAFLKAKGVEMWMWGDMLARRHNGGPPFDCHKALDLVPKDIVICNWSAEYAEGSSREFAEKGFRVVKANSDQVPSSEQPYVFGNLASFWYRTPWCGADHTGERGVLMRTARAAEFSWNVNKENVSRQRFIRERDVNIARLLARPRMPHAGPTCVPVSLAPAVNRAVVDAAAGDGVGWADLGPDQDLRALPSGEIRVGSASFGRVGGGADAKRVVYVTAAEPRTKPVSVRRRAASLIFLHTVVLPADGEARGTFFKRFLRPVDGVPVAVCRVTYTDGHTTDVPIRFGAEVGSWRPTREAEYLPRCPYLVRLATDQCRKASPGATDVALYVYEWPNPRDGRIGTVEFVHTGTEAAYALVALSTRERKK